jgi:hypothetical protein
MKVLAINISQCKNMYHSQYHDSQSAMICASNNLNTIKTPPKYKSVGHTCGLQRKRRRVIGGTGAEHSCGYLARSWLKNPESLLRLLGVGYHPAAKPGNMAACHNGCAASCPAQAEYVPGARKKDLVPQFPSRPWTRISLCALGSMLSCHSRYEHISHSI